MEKPAEDVKNKRKGTKRDREDDLAASPQCLPKRPRATTVRNPEGRLSKIFVEIVDSIMRQDEVCFLLYIFTYTQFTPFQVRIDGNYICDYYDVIKHPMYLQLIKQRAKEGEYTSVHEFQRDINLLVDNCVLYNEGKPSAWLIPISQQLLQVVFAELEEVCNRQPVSSVNQCIEKRRIVGTRNGCKEIPRLLDTIEQSGNRSAC